MQVAEMILGAAEEELLALVGQTKDDVYIEHDGPEFSNGVQARIVVQSVDPTFAGRVKAEMQLIDPDGFAVFYSEPQETLKGQWIGKYEGEKYLLVID